MVLFKANEKNSPECEETMYAGQTGIQLLLVLISVAYIPWMLLVKPLMQRKQPKGAGEEEVAFYEVIITQVLPGLSETVMLSNSLSLGYPHYRVCVGHCLPHSLLP